MVDFSTVASVGFIHIIWIPQIKLPSQKVNSSQKNIKSSNQSTLFYHLDLRKTITLSDGQRSLWNIGI